MTQRWGFSLEVIIMESCDSPGIWVGEVKDAKEGYT